MVALRSASALTWASISAPSALSLSAFRCLSAFIREYTLSAISPGKSALFIRTSSTSIPNSNNLGVTAVLTLAIITSLWVVMISDWL